jgi:hypothetical protein
VTPEALHRAEVRRRQESAALGKSAAVVSLPTGDSSSIDPETAQIDFSDTLAEPGVYQVAFDREERARPWGRDVWYIHMKIVEPGEHHGKPVLFPLSGLPRKKRPRRGFKLVSSFIIATGRKPPRDLWRMKPSQFLSGCVFTAMLRTSSKNANGVTLPEAAHYSKVDYLVERVSGAPPYLMRIKGNKP